MGACNFFQRLGTGGKVTVLLIMIIVGLGGVATITGALVLAKPKVPSPEQTTKSAKELQDRASARVAPATTISPGQSMLREGALGGQWVFSRIVLECSNFELGCQANDIPISFDNCADQQCRISRTDGIGKSGHPISRDTIGVWSGSFNDITIHCKDAGGVDSYYPATIKIQFTITSFESVASSIRATRLTGTYGFDEYEAHPNCGAASGKGHTLQKLSATRF